MVPASPVLPQFAGASRAIAARWPADKPIANPGAAAALFNRLADQPEEQVHIAYLDPQWRLLGLREAESARAACVIVPVRQMVTDALALGAGRVVMAHNHPSGDSTPSEQDLASTRRIARALALVEVRLVDHLVMARGGTTSLRAMGLL